MKAYLTNDPDNKEEHYDVERGAIQQRDSRSDPSLKFATNIADESLKVGNRGGSNKLGTMWQEKYSGVKGDYVKLMEFMPSLNQIFVGIQKEQKRQLILTSGLKENSKIL